MNARAAAGVERAGGVVVRCVTVEEAIRKNLIDALSRHEARCGLCLRENRSGEQQQDTNYDGTTRMIQRKQGMPGCRESQPNDLA